MNDFFTSANQEYGLDTVMPEDVAITFELDGAEGGVWTLSREGETVRVEPSARSWSDCHLQCSVPDFQALVAGELEGTRSVHEWTAPNSGGRGLDFATLRGRRRLGVIRAKVCVCTRYRSRYD